MRRKVCAEKSARYHGSEQSSGRDSGVPPANLEYLRVLRRSLLFQLPSIDLDRLDTYHRHQNDRHDDVTVDWFGIVIMRTQRPRTRI
jgi:hypothetical protein